MVFSAPTCSLILKLEVFLSQRSGSARSIPTHRTIVYVESGAKSWSYDKGVSDQRGQASHTYVRKDVYPNQVNERVHLRLPISSAQSGRTSLRIREDGAAEVGSSSGVRSSAYGIDRARWTLRRKEFQRNRP